MQLVVVHCTLYNDEKGNHKYRTQREENGLTGAMRWIARGTLGRGQVGKDCFGVAWWDLGVGWRGGGKDTQRKRYD